MDGRIESSAAKPYVFKTYLTNDSIKTESKNGDVTLTGTVSDAKDRSLAQDTVENLPGVKSVDNQLKVSGPQPAVHSDTWIGMKVKWAVLFHRNVSATGTDVYVKDGVVTLEGTQDIPRSKSRRDRSRTARPSTCHRRPGIAQSPARKDSLLRPSAFHRDARQPEQKDCSFPRPGPVPAPPEWCPSPPVHQAAGAVPFSMVKIQLIREP